MVNRWLHPKDYRCKFITVRKVQNGCDRHFEFYINARIIYRYLT